jgi:hypothetical protein
VVARAAEHPDAHAMYWVVHADDAPERIETSDLVGKLLIDERYQQ